MQPRYCMNKILVAVDGSASSLHAARLALELARATGARLTVAHSVQPMNLPGELPFVIAGDVIKAEIARGKELLAKAIKELGATDVIALELEGSPAERIAEVAEKDGYDLVVVGSRGLNAIARVFLGSVATRLVHVCKQPVLVVR